MKPDTYGVSLTPHFEKYQYQDEETADLMHETWNFGNALKALGYKVAYMHGPIGLYEGIEIRAEKVYLEANCGPIQSTLTVSNPDPVDVLPVPSVGNVQRFIDIYPNKDMFAFFLYQKLPDRVTIAALNQEVIRERRKKLETKKKKKKLVDDPIQ